MANVEGRIDVQINQMAAQNVKRNEQILPYIVDVVMLCATQQIALRGHRDDKVDFAQAPVANEGNFIAIIRLLAESNPALKEHLISGPKNARYTSKTVQTELINVAADLFRDYFRKCLEKHPHFAIIADETTSQGREVLSVCIRLLDFLADPSKPKKREVLIDICDLERMTGQTIAKAIQKSVERNKISTADCKGQAYDTTASMSSDKKGVQAEISKLADYQGCCLHGLNLVICHACKIPSIVNMMDNCRELFSFFDNSPKRQRFLEVIIHALSPDAKKVKLKNLCKTRWIERHTAFETIFELYEYIVVTLDEICQPTTDERFYPHNEEWSWDTNTRTAANGLWHTMASFGHIVNFVCAKVLLEPMRPLVTSLQGRLMEVYFGFQKIEEVNLSYVDIRKGIDEWFQHMYVEVLAVAEKVGSTEQWPRVCGRQTQRKNCPSESVAEYWKRTVAIPFLDVICSEMKSRFSQDKRAHYELCALIPEVIVKQSTAEVKELGQCLLVKWNHVMPLPSAFQSELQRWMNYWKRQLPISASSVTSLLTFHADATFFPNLRELLKILAVLPVGSVEAERSFSCLRRIHNWLRNTMATEKLSDLAVIAMHGHEVPISKADICKGYMDLHPRRMMASSLFDDRDGD
uniref:52 kDa repressor of the inhibitor of the protein kinase-like n=1 Tax=Myxine glutinosa TaxID=7769 RepID=UPI00358F763F